MRPGTPPSQSRKAAAWHSARRVQPCGYLHCGVGLVEVRDTQPREWRAPPLLPGCTGALCGVGRQPKPWTIWIFSANVISCNTMSARWSGVRLVLLDGCCILCCAGSRSQSAAPASTAVRQPATAGVDTVASSLRFLSSLKPDAEGAQRILPIIFTMLSSLAVHALAPLYSSFCVASDHCSSVILLLPCS
jgi:hypothetical protein